MVEMLSFLDLIRASRIVRKKRLQRVTTTLPTACRLSMAFSASAARLSG
jgi:hypothetical protein